MASWSMKDLLRRVAEKSLSDLKVDEEVERVVKLVREKGEKEQKVKRDEVAHGLPSALQRSVFALRRNSLVLLGKQFQLQKWQLMIPLVYWVVWWTPDIGRGWE